MIANGENKIYRKLLEKGKGSILKAVRTDKGGGKGMIAGGLVLLGFGLVFGLPSVLVSVGVGLVVLAVFLLPALLLIGFGMKSKKKRESSWLSFYQERYGFTETELKQIDNELASPSVSLVICKSPGASTNNFIYAFLTEHYVLINGMNPYVKRLEDIIAVAFSDSTNIWCLLSLTKQDDEVMAIPLFADTWKKQELCQEVISELHRHNPEILCGQEIVCEDRTYILEKDSAEILRLFNEGRKLQTV